MGEILYSKKLGNRVLLIVVGFITVLICYFSYNTYRTFLVNAEDYVLDKLYSLAKTTALQIDGDKHERLTESYPEMNAITSNYQDSLYLELHEKLKAVARTNEFNTPIYTLVKSKNQDYFEFVTTSSEVPFYRHSYKQFPETLVERFDVGGTLSAYESENGTWLSAFAPVKNSDGEAVAIVQVDQQFDEFKELAYDKLLRNLLASMAIAVVIIFVLISWRRPSRASIMQRTFRMR